MVEKFKPIDLEQPFRLRKKPEITSEIRERGRIEYTKRLNELVLKAILKHIEGVSYRGMRVGSSVIAANADANGEFQVESAHNFKPRRLRQYGWDKLCAENNACTAAILDGGEYISGLVVVSNHQNLGTDPEDATHSEKALHSCQNCRNLYRELIGQGIMSEETMIRFVNDESLVYEDAGDPETLIPGSDTDPRTMGISKLKLKKEITESDIDALPYEEMTIGEFLHLPD